MGGFTEVSKESDKILDTGLYRPMNLDPGILKDMDEEERHDYLNLMKKRFDAFYRTQSNWNHVTEDEFDKSLDNDLEATLLMNEPELKEYIKNLIRKRTIVHDKDLEKVG
ncbi:MAG: hypothetical protein ACI9GH_000605 [Candidatus Paceibacteria bacterium]